MLGQWGKVVDGGSMQWLLDLSLKMTYVSSIYISLAKLDVNMVGEIEFSHKEGQRIFGTILPVDCST